MQGLVQPPTCSGMRELAYMAKVCQPTRALVRPERNRRPRTTSLTRPKTPRCSSKPRHSRRFSNTPAYRVSCSRSLQHPEIGKASSVSGAALQHATVDSLEHGPKQNPQVTRGLAIPNRLTTRPSNGRNARIEKGLLIFAAALSLIYAYPRNERWSPGHFDWLYGSVVERLTTTANWISIAWSGGAIAYAVLETERHRDGRREAVVGAETAVLSPCRRGSRKARACLPYPGLHHVEDATIRCGSSCQGSGGIPQVPSRAPKVYVQFCTSKAIDTLLRSPTRTIRASLACAGKA